MRKTLLSIALGLGAYASTLANGTYVINKTSSTITIDGNLSEWANVPATGAFTNHETGAAGTASATAKLLWDDTNLYLAFEVTDNDVTANYVNQDDNLFDNDDLVEMFFDFDGSGTNYLELGVSATGVNYDFNIICPGTGGCGTWNSNATWDIVGLETAGVVNGTLNNSSDTDNGYVVEVKIPLASLASMTGGNYSTVQEGTTWKGNLFKINYNTGAGTHAGTDYLAWNVHNAFGFHQPTKFGTFEFGGLSVGNQEISRNLISIQQNGLNNYQISSEKEFTVTVVDLLGKVHFSPISSLNQNLDLNNLPKGIYFINTVQNGVLETKKVVVR